jgi:hypothetical protein
MGFEILRRIDKKGRILVVSKIVVEIFRICMACGLCVFVPQNCSRDGNPVLCTIHCNMDYRCLTKYKLFAALFNCFTMFCFSLLYLIEIKRDEWMMKHFELDTDKADSNLDYFRSKYRPLFRKLNNYNSMYYTCYKSICVIYICNVGISVAILYYAYYDLTTVTVLLTNISLCSTKIYNGIIVSRSSLEKNVPMCYYSKIFLSFNKIDENCITRDETGPFSSLGRIVFQRQVTV